MATKLARLGTMVALAGAVACGSDPVAPDWDTWPHGRIVLPAGMNLSAAITYPAESPGRALMWVTATNTGTTPATMSYNDCAFGIRVYQGATATGDPVYHNERTPQSSCLTITRQATLAAGASQTLPVADISMNALRGAVGGGTFTVTVTYRTEVEGIVREVPAGPLTL
jgi:hypothetical protein